MMDFVKWWALNVPWEKDRREDHAQLNEKFLRSQDKLVLKVQQPD